MKKWKTVIALILLILAIFLEWNWFWALYIFLGLMHIIYSEEIYFVESITKKENPKLYWLMIVLWASMGGYQIWS